jgi:hypothetical protein
MSAMNNTTRTITHTVSKRRISWSELYRIRPDLRPANQNAHKDIAAGFSISGELAIANIRMPLIGRLSSEF